jgi:hypothetical protein
MKNMQTYQRIVLILVALTVTVTWNSAGWSHGDKTSIIPEVLSVKAGAKLKVVVKGLTDTKTATFTLTGLSGKFDLGQYSINSDDFSQILEIPSDLPPGSYRLTVEGGGKSAKVVITVS